MERRRVVDKLTVSMIEYTRDCEEYWGGKDDTKTDQGFFMKAAKNKLRQLIFFVLRDRQAHALKTEIILKGNKLGLNYEAWLVNPACDHSLWATGQACYDKANCAIQRYTFNEQGCAYLQQKRCETKKTGYDRCQHCMFKAERDLMPAKVPMDCSPKDM